MVLDEVFPSGGKIITIVECRKRWLWFIWEAHKVWYCRCSYCEQSRGKKIWLWIPKRILGNSWKVFGFYTNSTGLAHYLRLT
jgi:hypothetical protein